MDCVLSVGATWRLEPVGRADYERAGAPCERNPGIMRCRFVQCLLRLAGALAALYLIPVPAVSNDEVQPDKFSDWNRIETLSAGVRTKIRFLEGGSSDDVIVKGRLSSFNETSIVLMLDDGGTQSIQRDSVRVVRVRRSLLKRRMGWIAGAGAAAIACALATCDADITPIFMPILTAAYAAPIGLVGCLLSPTRLVYRSSAADD